MNHQHPRKVSDEQKSKNKSLAIKLFVLALMFFAAFIYATWMRGQ